jgi:hypothetical protein
MSTAKAGSPVRRHSSRSSSQKRNPEQSRHSSRADNLESNSNFDIRADLVVTEALEQSRDENHGPTVETPPHSHLTGAHLDSLQHHQAQIFRRWEREDAADDSLQSLRACVTFFKRPHPRLKGIKRSPSEPPAVHSERVAAPILGTVRAPVSPWFRNQLQIPAVERLLAGRVKSEPTGTSRSKTTTDKWEGFLFRQSLLENDKRRREWRVREKPRINGRDGPVYDKLYEESLMELPGGFASGSTSVHQMPTPCPQQPPSFIEEGSRLPRPLRSTTVGGEAERFGVASQEIVKDKSSFRQRCEATWDLKAILSDERGQELEAQKRREFSDEDKARPVQM